MKWTTTNREVKLQARKQWHKFFCLIPRKIVDNSEGKNVWVWLEYVECKGSTTLSFDIFGRLSNEWYYTYRLIEK